MNDRIVLTDDLLRRALTQRMAHSASPALLERIVAGAGATAQEPAPRSWLPRRPGAGADATDAPVRSRWTALPALGGAAAVALAAVLLVLAIRPLIEGPGATPSPTPTPGRTTQPLPTFLPESVQLGEFAARRLRLPVADPIDVTFADGSIWTANIHGDDVRRFDPETMDVLATIELPFGVGPAWFTVTDDALWVTNQLGDGLTRIDPATNQVVGQVGAGPTCGSPVQAFESIWQSICDGGTFLRIDPAAGTVLETFPADGHGFLALIDDRLITQLAPDAPTPDALTELDPADGTFNPLPFSIDGFRHLMGSDGEALWVMTFAGPQRIDPVDGEVIATFPYTDAGPVTFVDDRAWLTTSTQGVVEIDLATNEILRQIPVPAELVVALEVDGVLWITQSNGSYLWRIDL